MLRTPRWMRARLGVRVASALSAALVVAVAAAGASVVLVWQVRGSLSSTLELTAKNRAQQIAEKVGEKPYDEHRLNKIARNAVQSLATDTEIAQVVVTYPKDDGSPPDVKAEGGTVLAPPLSAPLSDIQPESAEPRVENAYVSLANRGRTHVVIAVAQAHFYESPIPVVTYFAVPLDNVDAAVDTLIKYLLIGLPILILVAGGATYLFAGRALRPVEAIRAQVATMTGRDLTMRVPVPPARDEVARLAETMNEMIARLEDAQAVQRRFVADASHELRSPLATVAAGLELLERDTTDPVTVDTLRTETERIGNLVDALLLLARADERGMQPRREDVDLDEVAQAEGIRPGREDVTVEVHADPVRVVGDRGQLVRVLRNLVDNARRHARSQVVVTVTREDDTAVVQVADDGPGVPEEDRERVFERFVRLDDARARSDGGSGLGLAIVAEVVAAHGGVVDLEGAPGGGALFRVMLPAAPQHAPVDSEDPRAVEISHPGMKPVPPEQPTTPHSGPAEPEEPTAPYPIPNPAPAGRRAARPAPVPTPPAGIRAQGRGPSTPPSGQHRQVRRPAPPAVPTPPMGVPAGPQPRGGYPPPVPNQRAPWLQAPVTDAEAKLDPPTAPWRIPEGRRPAERPRHERETDTDPHGIPAVSDQPGSTIR